MAQNQGILLTPPGAAAIAVIRLVGPAVHGFLKARFSVKAQSLRAVHGVLRDETGEVLDDPVVVLADDGRFADINLHGGAWLVRAVLSEAVKAGFEPIERIELPLPGAAIDATDEIDREIAAYLPLATTEPALRTLLGQADAWRILQARAQSLRPDEIDAILNDRSLHWLLHPPRVAIVGAANVGKSTLANQLFAQERSITADRPGTTRDWVGEIANLDGLAVQLVDTPGIRPTDDPIEHESIQRAAAQIQRADLIVLVLDASRLLDPDQSPLLARYSQVVKVVNKVDLGHAWDLSTMEAIHTAAKSGTGVDRLMATIRSTFGCDPIDRTTPRCWTTRQRRLLEALGTQR